MRRDHLLVEIGTEELPPKSLKTLAKVLAEQLTLGLQKADFEFENVQWYASPRRLAVSVTALAQQQPDRVEDKRGPAVSAAFDANGEPTKAALGWARGNGIDVSQAERLTTDKGEWLLHKAQIQGQSIHALLPNLLQKALNALPIPKPMRWGDSDAEFIRPVHTLTLLYGDELITANILGQESANVIQGHRFHGPATLELQHAEDYLSALRDAHVIADFSERQGLIKQGLEKIAEQHQAQVQWDQDLLDEVTALVEWPVVLSAQFEPRFLDVPMEALVATMKDDQKYFPLVDSNGALLPNFAFVSNIDSNDPAQVIAGNEKVIRPRLADAEFFYQADIKQSLESRLPSLEKILFQKQLGSLAQRSQRIAALAGFIATQIGADESAAKRAGLLAKADLVSQMVLEFPDVQGVMGKYYALNDGEPTEVAQAVGDQYKPAFAGDALPSSNVAAAVALADKIDVLVGIFGIGMLPKGDKDPFALRRAAIGILRIATELKLAFDLLAVFSFASDLYASKLTNADAVAQSIDFVLGRCRHWYQEQGISPEVLQAVLWQQPGNLPDLQQRLGAVNTFKELPAAPALAAANKRVANILNKNVESEIAKVKASLLVVEQEKQLFDALQASQAAVNQAVAASNYLQALDVLAQLREPIDAFFDQVMVMDEDLAVRKNRLGLLNELRSQFLQVADISHLSI